MELVVDKNINIGGSGVIAGRLDVDSIQDSTSSSSGAVRYCMVD